MTLSHDAAVCLSESIVMRAGIADPAGDAPARHRAHEGEGLDPGAWRAEIFTEPAAVMERWRALETRGGATPFQTTVWFGTWMDTIGAAHGAEPLIVVIVDEAGTDRLLLPLVRRRLGGLLVVEFPDLGVADYNAPVFDPELAHQSESWAAVWAAVRTALPAGLVRFEKMPLTVEGSSNPLARLHDAAPIELQCFAVALPETFEAYRADVLDPKIARELGEKRRRYQNRSRQVFGVVDNAADAERVFAALVAQRKARFAALGRAEILDDPVYHEFYRRLAVEHAADGFMVLSATEVLGEPAACSYAVRHGGRIVQLLSSTEENEWRRFSTGRLISDYTIEWAIEKGCDVFDFSIGDESYKLGFGARPAPMARLEVALSPRGWPVVWRSRLAAFVRSRPALRAAARRLRGLVGRWGRRVSRKGR